MIFVGTKLVSRQRGKGVPARRARDQHLEVGAAPEGSLFIVLLIATVTAGGRFGVPFKGGLLMLRRNPLPFGLFLAVVGAYAPAAAWRPIINVHTVDTFFSPLDRDSNL